MGGIPGGVAGHRMGTGVVLVRARVMVPQPSRFRDMTQARPIVLTIVGPYLPGYRAGGPVRSVAHMVEQLGNEFEFRVLAFDRDPGSRTPYDGISREWMEVGRAQVRYLVPDHLLSIALIRELRRTRYDLLYLQTLFDPRIALLPLALRRLGLIRNVPVVIAPRGQLGAGPLSLSRRRKRAYLAVTRFLLRGDEVWQATAESEAMEIANRIPGGRVIVAPNIPASAPARFDCGPKEPGRLRIVYLSRIARNKNLKGLLRALEGVEGDVALDIYGPMEQQDYWRECEPLIATLRSRGQRVEVKGPVPPHRVAETIAAYDLFALPTQGENFGHVILEALLAGCPCLISDRTPWQELQMHGAGWNRAPDDDAGMREVLRRVVAFDDLEERAARQAARSYGERYLASDVSVLASRTLIRSALEAG
jgi:glycosyltransferase involved in cell wall biosynthesis